MFQVLINSMKEHTLQKSRPLIYYDVVAILLPCELAGSNLGVLLSTMLPDTLLLIFSLIVILIASYLLLDKAVKLLDKELDSKDDDQHATVTDSNSNTRASNSAVVNDNNNTNANESESLLPKWASQSSSSSTTQAKTANGDSNTPDWVKEPPQPLINKSKGSDDGVDDDDDDTICFGCITKNPYKSLKLPWTTIYVILIFWAAYALVYVLMGLTETCSSYYFVGFIAVYLIAILQVLVALRVVILKQSEHPESVLPGDLTWNSTFCSAGLPIGLTFLIGILTSLLGIGGGELINPMLLILGVSADVTTATVSLMSFLNTSSNLIHYLTLGDFPILYALWLLLLGACGGILGRLTALLLASKTHHSSLFLFCLFFVLVLSAAVFVYYLVTDPVDFIFTGMCASSDDDDDGSR